MYYDGKYSQSWLNHFKDILALPSHFLQLFLIDSSQTSYALKSRRQAEVDTFLLVH